MTTLGAPVGTDADGLLLLAEQRVDAIHASRNLPGRQSLKLRGLGLTLEQADALVNLSADEQADVLPTARDLVTAHRMGAPLAGMVVEKARRAGVQLPRDFA